MQMEILIQFFASFYKEKSENVKKKKVVAATWRCINKYWCI